MTNFTVTEQRLSQALDEWALKVPGIVLVQKNPALFAQILRTYGFEIIPAGEVQRVRYEQKTIKSELLQAYKLMLALKTRLEETDRKEFLVDPEVEQLRTQLAGCGVAANGGIQEDQLAHAGDYGWSPAYQDVVELRKLYDHLSNTMKDQLDAKQPGEEDGNQ